MRCEGKHIWVGMPGDRWQCKECGIWGHECSACEGTGWEPPDPGEACDVDCETCNGDGVIPDLEDQE